jgi:hypothetical protein
MNNRPAERGGIRIVMNPSTNFAGRSEAKRFPYQTLRVGTGQVALRWVKWLLAPHRTCSGAGFATRASRVPVPPIAMSIYIPSNTAKLVRGYCLVTAIYPPRKQGGILADETIIPAR